MVDVHEYLLHHINMELNVKSMYAYFHVLDILGLGLTFSALHE